jgi:paraquat-inducible protein A
VAECARCGTALARHKPNSLARTAAFSLAALSLYIPANIYPILQMNLYGVRSESTVWDGCRALFEHWEVLVAAVVFLASMVIPLLKLVGLFVLVATTALGSPGRRPGRTWIARAIDIIGPWAMLDVFLLSVLVALVKLGELATVLPGPGLLAFSAMVVLSILASSSFDSRLIWAGEPVRR